MPIGGRCVAGIRLDGGGWIRPVSGSTGGELSPRQYRLADGSDAALLDVVRVYVQQPRPSSFQAENWLLAPKAWDLIARPMPAEYIEKLYPFVASGPELFGNTDDRLAEDLAGARAVASSLVLVNPQNLSWNVTVTMKGKQQVRALFALGGVHYNLVVTDPEIERCFSQRQQGTYGLQAAGIDPSEGVLLTISLGEPFQGCCYKLVAGVVIFRNNPQLALSLLKYRLQRLSFGTSP